MEQPRHSFRYDSNQERTAPRGLEQTLNTSDESSESFQENLPSIKNINLAKTNNLKDKSETSTISNNVLSITVDSKGRHKIKG